jgi:arsenate reductase (glutaredoxin)
VKEVQIFGVKKSSATRAAERFFKGRGIKVHFVDLDKKPMSPGEIKRFIDKFQLLPLIDTTAKAYTDGGFQYLRVTPEQWLQKIEQSPLLLKLPLIRCGAQLAIGEDTTSWKAMVS